jgi:16S rRNA (guanine(966)-N(2))-methyltransferase RsmD
MRVIAGEAKGRRLQVPRGLAVRPSGARLRESAFGILEHRGAIAGARVLDVYAGTGALGLEALSRGAASLVAIEADADVARLLRRNAEHCGFGERTRVIVQDAIAALAQLARESFDLVFLDPPYRSREIGEALSALVRHGLVAPGGRVVAEHRRGDVLEPCDGLAIELDRRYGDSIVTVLQPEGSIHATL